MDDFSHLANLHLLEDSSQEPRGEKSSVVLPTYESFKLQ